MTGVQQNAGIQAISFHENILGGLCIKRDKGTNINNIYANIIPFFIFWSLFCRKTAVAKQYKMIEHKIGVAYLYATPIIYPELTTFKKLSILNPCALLSDLTTFKKLSNRYFD